VRPVATRRAIAVAVVVAAVAGNAALVGFAGAQTGRGAPPPTPVPPDGRPSPFPSVLVTPRDAVAVPTVAARSAILADLDDGTVLFRKAASTPLPIASLTKIMTAVVVLSRTSPGEVVRVSADAVFDRDDFGATSTLGLRAGERLTVRDLLYGMLLGSANDAAEALAIHVGGDVDGFVRLMNRRAAALGMRDTSFASPHGLDDRGRSTAEDLLVLLETAHGDPRFAAIVATRFHTIPAPQGPARRIQNRNALLWLYDGAIGTKTGLTLGAGPCLAAVAERDGRRLVAIVLGADGEAFSPAATLLNHGFEGFTEEIFMRAGQDAGVVDLIGGTVPVVAGEDLTASIPTAHLGRVRRTVRVMRGAAFPPAPGDRVATLVVSVPGLRVGSVPLVVPAVPPPDPVEGSWLARGLGALGRAAGEALGAIVG
jgi:D-alanyl-D-alanine carboxypeptidase (penicillin-binding protein 5/6)